jgi:hypothetical protein
MNNDKLYSRHEGDQYSNRDIMTWNAYTQQVKGLMA